MLSIISTGPARLFLLARKRPVRGPALPPAGRSRWRHALAGAVLAAVHSPGWAADPPGSLSSPVQEGTSGTVNAPLFEEEIPPFGKGNMLSAPQIRYCLAEFIRIEAVRPVLNRYRHDQVEFFNALIAAFNSRCAKYRYELPTMESAKHEVESHRAQIGSVARQAFVQRFSGPPPKPADQAVIAAAPQAQSGPSAAETPSAAKAGTPATEALPAPPPAAEAPAPAQPVQQATPAQPPAARQTPAAALPAPAVGPEPGTAAPAPSIAREPKPAAAPSEALATAAPPPAAAESSAPAQPKPHAAARVERPPQPIPVAEVPPSLSESIIAPVEPAQPQAAKPTPAPDTPARRTPVQTAAPAPEPAMPPAEPVTPLAKPAGQTTEPAPVAKPGTPVAEPAAPVAEPATRVAEPAVPAAKPGVPVAEPAAPAPEPATPVAEPTTPVAEPAAPAVEPATPVAEPSPPLAEPEAPAAEPATPEAPKVARVSPPLAAASKDPALVRFSRDVQRAGTRVIDRRRLPTLASMGKNWSGKAQIEVQFAPGGYISRIVLAESCGHAPLDEKALEIARTIVFPHVPKALSAREFSVRFPIEFRSGKG